MQSLLTSAQSDVLHAAFLRHPDAGIAWKRWRDGVNWNDHLDHTSFSLLPLVYRNLNRLGIKDSLFPRFRGIIRQSWLANQRWLAQLEPTLAACARDDIEVLILPPTRRLLFDSSAVVNRKEPLLWAVRPEHAVPALHCLLGAGWNSREVRLPRWSLAGYTAGARHLMLHDDRNQPLNLTWGLEWWFGGRVGDVWAGAGDARLGRQPVRRLNTTDALAFALRRPVSYQPFGRIAGVLMIAGNEQPDWHSLKDTIRHHPPAPDWSAALSLLQPYFDQWGAPQDLQSWFSSPPVDAASARPRASLVQRYQTDWSVYRSALGEHHGRATALTQLPGYLMGRWRLHGLDGLPKHLLRWFDPNFRASRSEG